MERLKKIFEEVIKPFYYEKRNQIIFAFIVGTILAIPLNIECGIWFIMLWILLLYEIVNKYLKRNDPNYKFTYKNIIVYLVVGIYLSLILI